MEIDNEFRNYIRPLSAEEFEKLKTSVLAEGIRDPLVTWQGILLDGYHRYKIAQESGLEYKTVEVELPDRDAAKEWILINQLGRRNLTEQEASYYRGKLYSARKQSHGGQVPGMRIGKNFPSINTAEEIGKQYGVTGRTIKNDEQFSRAVDKVASEVGDDAKQAILSGKASVPKERVEQLIDINLEAPKYIEPILNGSLSIADAVRQIKRADRIEKIVQKTAEPLDGIGVFPVIYADPPWEYDHPISDSRRIENQYPTMSLDEIMSLPVKDIAADDAILFLWVTTPMLEKGLKVLNAWGFDYRTSMVWVKPSIGPGQWVRQRHEYLLIGVRGDIPTPQGEDKPDSVIEAPREEHSKKPELVYDIIERMYPELPKVELFSRCKRENWTAWGNEI